MLFLFKYHGTNRSHTSVIHTHVKNKKLYTQIFLVHFFAHKNILWVQMLELKLCHALVGQDVCIFLCLWFFPSRYTIHMSTRTWYKKISCHRKYCHLFDDIAKFIAIPAWRTLFLAQKKKDSALHTTLGLVTLHTTLEGLSTMEGFTTPDGLCLVHNPRWTLYLAQNPRRTLCLVHNHRWTDWTRQLAHTPRGTLHLAHSPRRTLCLAVAHNPKSTIHLPHNPRSALHITKDGNCLANNPRWTLHNLDTTLEGLFTLHTTLDGLSTLHTILDGLFTLHTILQGLFTLHTILDGLSTLQTTLEGLCLAHDPRSKALIKYQYVWYSIWRLSYFLLSIPIGSFDYYRFY